MNFEQLVKNNNKLIWQVAHKYSIRGNNADDLYQECLMKVWNVYKQYNNEYAITTFLRTILENHLSNLCRESNVDKRVNKDANKNNLDDIKNFDFKRYNTYKVKYTKHQEYILDIAFDILEVHPKKDIIERVLYGETQTAIAKELGVSRQYVSKQFNDYILLVNNTLKGGIE